MKASNSPIDITFLLDRSGSMKSVAAATIQGFNAFLQDRQQADGEARMSLVQFNHRPKVLYSDIPVREIVPLDAASYQPDGNTALLDAIGRAVKRTKKRLIVAGGARKVIFVVLTDGEENASRHYSRSQVFDTITAQREQHGWEFIFLGANQDAIGEAARMGMDQRSAINYEATDEGTRRAFTSASASVDSISAKSDRAKDRATTESDGGDRDQQSQ